MNRSSTPQAPQATLNSANRQYHEIASSNALLGRANSDDVRNTLAHFHAADHPAAAATFPADPSVVPALFREASSLISSEINIGASDSTRSCTPSLDTNGDSLAEEVLDSAAGGEITDAYMHDHYFINPETAAVLDPIPTFDPTLGPRLTGLNLAVNTAIAGLNGSQTPAGGVSLMEMWLNDHNRPWNHLSQKSVHSVCALSSAGHPPEHMATPVSNIEDHCMVAHDHEDELVSYAGAWIGN
ncbi:hypothetical protein LTR37_014495 [Vermiconidia calcicola]|uniref:Uncharacterized protein n=1 Tax=Vermiconidia calcicola TaxID=1690605 RepID=A0ACC3MTH9_9PEZI|nr:hypothetical protein LTR37_014495 [Vermiconidia calcicola]